MGSSGGGVSPDHGGIIEGSPVTVAPEVAVIPILRWRSVAGVIEAEPVAVIVSRRSGVTRLAVHGAGGANAGRDAGRDMGQDSGQDAGRDAGRDAGEDAGRDASPGAAGSEELGAAHAEELDEATRVKLLEAAIGGGRESLASPGLSLCRVRMDPRAPTTQVACRVIATGDSVRIESVGSG